MAKKRKKTGKFDRGEIFQWMILTLLFLIVAMICGTLLMNYVEEKGITGYFIDQLNEGYWALALMVWSIVSVMLGLNYAKD